MTPSYARPDPAVDVPDDAETWRCPHCDRPFASDRQRDLHVGQWHADAMDDAERDAYEAARADERDAMWLYHLKVVVVLMVIWMLTGLLYLIVLG